MNKTTKHSQSKRSKHAPERGFTLLIASLIASLLTSIGLAMFTVAQKEIMLSGLGRDSQYAFYAADAGAECALYWDFKSAFNPNETTHGATCNEMVIGEYRPGESAGPEDLVIGGKAYVAGTMTNSFTFEQNGHCVEVDVVKRINTEFATTIDSRGYSTACDQETNPRRLERAVRMRY